MIAPVRPRILAIDPGSFESGVVVYDPVIDSPVVFAKKLDNLLLLRSLRERSLPLAADDGAPAVDLSARHVLAIEWMRANGMKTSNEDFETMAWVGRFVEAWGHEWHPVWRRHEKQHLLGHVHGNDTQIRAELIERFGGDAAIAKRRACPTCHGAGLRGRGAQRGPCAACEGSGKTGSDGVLAGVTTDCWSALAIAVTYAERGPSVATAQAAESTT